MQPPTRGRGPEAPPTGGAAGDDDPIEARIRAWARRPSADETVALCDELRRTANVRGQHVDAIARAVSERYAGHAAVLLSLGRLQLALGKLSDAQQTLVAAGRADPSARGPYRYLGEVLLRRGDAARAERMFEKAVDIEARLVGAVDPNEEPSAEWLARAKSLRIVQDAQGEGAVAAEMAALLLRGGRRSSLPPPRSSLRPLAPIHADSDDAPTHVGRVPDQLRRQATPGFDTRVDGRAPAMPALRPKATPPPLPPSQPPAPRAAPARVAVTAPPVIVDDMAATRIGPDDSAMMVHTGDFVEARADHAAAHEAESVPHMRTPPPTDVSSEPRVPTNTGQLRALRAQAVTLGDPEPIAPADSAEPAGTAAWATDRVLRALEGAGVYEPAAAAASPAQWMHRRDVARPRRRGAWLYAVLAVLVGGGVFGAIYGGSAYKAKQRGEAEDASLRAETSVRKANLGALGEAETALGRAFELDSRTLRGARVWLEDRVLRSYVWPSEDRREGGLASAIERAKTVGLGEPDVAFARIALALSSDDTPSAAALARTLDPGAAKEKNDAWRELTVGWVLERAGDARAVDRYAHAAELDPELVPARLALAKLAALSGDEALVETSTKDFAGELTATREDLLALAKLVNTGQLGKGGAPEPRRPAGFGSINPALIVADSTVAPELRRKEAARAVGLARDPGDLTRIGRLAAAAGDDATASRAALRALEASPIFPPARALGARLALSVGRPDDAARALEGVSSEGDAELAALRAWLAYERQDLAEVQRALDAIPAAGAARADLAPIAKPLGFAIVMSKRSVATLSSKDRAELTSLAALGEVGPLVAFDLALGALDLSAAETIAKGWTEGEGVGQRPARALRVARLARLQGRAEEADKLSKIAVEQGTVTPAALVERVLVLGGTGKGAEALMLLARYPLLAVDEQPWLRAWATAQAGKTLDAKKQVDALKEPDRKGPWAVRRDALLALAAVSDKRAKGYAKDLFRERPNDPDVRAIGRSLGVIKD